MTLISCSQKLWVKFSVAHILFTYGPSLKVNVAMYWDSNNLILSKCLNIHEFISFSFVSHVLLGLNNVSCGASLVRGLFMSRAKSSMFLM